MLRRIKNGILRRLYRREAQRNYASLAKGRRDFPELKQAKQNRPSVLFVTSNGAGMGHLTRCMAIAKSGRPYFDSAFVTLSSSAPIVAEFGFPYIYFKSHKATDLPPNRWNLHFEYFMREVLSETAFDAVVFDGTWIYNGLLTAVGETTSKLIWLRRGLWKDTAKTGQLSKLEELTSLILTPEDIADESDQGPLADRTDFVRVPAITLTSDADLLDPITAKKELRLRPEKRYVLLQLGAGNINDIASVRQMVIESLAALNAELEPVIAVSPLSSQQELPSGVKHVIKKYPIAPYLLAFDFVVGAAGYNSIHELARFNVPGLIIPNMATATDNQELRAESFAKAGAGYVAVDYEQVIEGLELLVLADSWNSRDTYFRGINFDSGGEAAKQILKTLSQN